MPLRRKPEDEDEEDEKRKERGNVVHGAQHDDELVAKSRQEADQLEYAQQAECTQHRQTAGATLHQLHQTANVVNMCQKHFNSVNIMHTRWHAVRDNYIYARP